MSLIKVNITGLTAKQNEIAQSIIRTPPEITKYHILRASRQSGKTFLLERMAFYFALTHPSHKIAFIMATYPQTLKVYREMLPIIPSEIISSTNSSPSDRHIAFLNGSMIQFYSQKAINSIIGSTFDAIVADEVALWGPGNLALIEPTIAAKKHSRAVFASTPRGKNDFYTLSEEARSGGSFSREYRMSYLDNPHYDIRMVDRAKRILPSMVFSQEYLAEFVFGQSQIFGTFSGVQKISSWREPNPSETYYAAIDVAGTGEDCTVLTIVNEKGHVVFVYECQEDKMPAQAKEILPILRKWSPTTAVETNGLGAGLADILELNYPIDRFVMTNEKKAEMVGIVLEKINTGQINLPTADLCPKLDNEMTTYIAVRLPSGKLQYKHPPGLHDDYVDSLMMAFYQQKQGIVGRFTVSDPIEDYEVEDLKDLFGY
jgi:hypothetical protein